MSRCKPNDFTLCFTLKQHTPMIHFQADQKGATLRATELKPKLDRFLLKKLGEGDYERGIKVAKENKWLVGNGEHPALDYKVRIRSEIKNNNLKYKTYLSKRDRRNKNNREGAYFGDHFAVEFSNIEVEMKSFSTALLKEIEKYIEVFFVCHNFGTRSNKGFGSFEVEEINQKKTNTDIESLLKNHYVILNKLNTQNPLKEILNFYQDVKSGSKIRKTKSKLMKYFFDKNIRWEKRWIKKKLQEQNQTLFNDLKDEYHKKHNFNFDENENYLFIRVLLGLAGNIEFITNSYEAKQRKANDLNDEIIQIKDENKKRELIKKKKNLMKEANSLKIIVSIEHNEPNKETKIERFASPILFKVINNDIYVLMQKEKPLHREILNKNFTFIASYKNGKEKTTLKPNLKTPNLTDDELIKMYKNIFGYKQNKKSNSYQKNQQKNFNNPFENLKDFI